MFRELYHKNTREAMRNEIIFSGQREANMSLCNYCEYRNSYDCEDGNSRSENCDSFKLDFLILSKKQKKKIKKILSREEE